MTDKTPATNPCRRAYIDHQGPSQPRESWDLTTTLFAVRGNSDQFYTVHRGGHNLVNASDGTNKWVDERGPPSNEAYLIPKVPNTTVAAVIDRMLNRMPKNTKGAR